MRLGRLGWIFLEMKKGRFFYSDYFRVTLDGFRIVQTLKIPKNNQLDLVTCSEASPFHNLYCSWAACGCHGATQEAPNCEEPDHCWMLGSVPPF